MPRGEIAPEKRCTFIKPSGSRCGAPRYAGKETCRAHDPDAAAQLAQERSAGGRGRSKEREPRAPSRTLSGRTPSEATRLGWRTRRSNATRRRTARREPGEYAPPPIPRWLLPARPDVILDALERALDAVSPEDDNYIPGRELLGKVKVIVSSLAADNQRGVEHEEAMTLREAFALVQKLTGEQQPLGPIGEGKTEHDTQDRQGS